MVVVAEAGEGLADEVADVVGSDRLRHRAGGTDGDGLGGGVRRARRHQDLGRHAGALQAVQHGDRIEPIGVGVQHDQPRYQVGQWPDQATHGLVPVAERHDPPPVGAQRVGDGHGVVRVLEHGHDVDRSRHRLPAAHQRADAEDLGPTPALASYSAWSADRSRSLTVVASIGNSATPALNEHWNVTPSAVAKGSPRSASRSRSTASQRRRRGHAVEHEHELLAAPPPGQRRLGVRAQLGEAAQHLVTDVVTVLVVDSP